MSDFAPLTDPEVVAGIPAMKMVPASRSGPHVRDGHGMARGSTWIIPIIPSSACSSTCVCSIQAPSASIAPDGPLPDAEIARIRTWIEQGAKTDAMCVGTTAPIPNAAPVVIIDHPGDGEIRYLSAGTYPFVVRATDAEDGDLAAVVVWTSSLEGQFGTGTGFDHVLQPAGVHVVTASVTDSAGVTGSASITLEMRP